MLLLLSAALAADATGVRMATGTTPGAPLTQSGMATARGTFNVGGVVSGTGPSAVALYDDGSRAILFGDALLADLAFAYDAGNHWQIAVGQPFVLSATAAEGWTDGFTADGWVSVGWSGAGKGPLRYGLTGRISAPSGTPYGPLTTEGGVAGRLLAQARFERGPMLLSSEGGIALRPAFVLGFDEDLAALDAGMVQVPLSLAARRAIGSRFASTVEVAALFTPTADAEVGAAGAELLAHLDVRVGPADFVLGAGVGLGDALGVPESRIFGGLRTAVVTHPRVEDLDGDGIPDAQDRCPALPEDKDGFEDDDGCPDEDNDRDGIPDAVDQCPNDPEDRDGWQDQDGCPDPDNDGDGLIDSLDICPLDPGPPGNRGCPPPSGRVTVRADRIDITDRIFFDTGRATIQEVSFPLLREVAAAINAAPEIVKVQVSGHTDSEGDDQSNLALSQARADSVRTFLVTYGGVNPERLVARGFGETMPIADNATEEGRAQNRRVEFVIVLRR
jgi:outer membrane protein OmpA-like peptidoglycan-associated protein